MHFLGTNLQFHPLPAGTDDRRMDGTIIVGFWSRDIILEATWDAWPDGMNNSQCLITGRNVVNKHAKSINIRKLLETQLLALHFTENGIGPFLTTPYLHIQALLGKGFLQFTLNLFDQAFILRAQTFQSG